MEMALASQIAFVGRPRRLWSRWRLQCRMPPVHARRRILRRLLMTLAGAIWTAAPAQPAPNVVLPSWLRPPDREAISRAYPSEALRAKLNGYASIQCTVPIDGSLQNCRVLEEDPVGYGFGSAALAIAPQFAMKPKTVNGQPVPSQVLVPIQFLRFPNARVGSMPHKVDWISAPTVAQVAAVFPASLRGTASRFTASLDCVIGRDGHLVHCSVFDTAQSGGGYDAAAISLSRLFVAAAQDSHGRPTSGERTIFRVNFDPAILDLHPTAQSLDEPAPWVAWPSDSDVKTAFPLRLGGQRDKSADVEMNCDIVADGRLGNCEVDREEPAGEGLAAAMLSLAPKYRFPLWSDSGLPFVGTRTRVGIHFGPQSPTARPVPAKPLLAKPPFPTTPDTG